MTRGDDLGRVVIPKEIRRTMHIREGDPLEIYTNSSGEVIFKKYSPMGEMLETASSCAKALARAISMPVLICDREHCIAAEGISKKEVLEKRITSTLDEIMEKRKSVNFISNEPFGALEGIDKTIKGAVPINNAGDISGAVVLLNNEKGENATETDIKLIEVAADFLGKQVE